MPPADTLRKPSKCRSAPQARGLAEIAGFDYDSGAILVAAKTNIGEVQLVAALEAWNLRPEKLPQPWQTDDPKYHVTGYNLRQCAAGESRRCALSTAIAQFSMSHPLSWHCMQRPVARCGLGGSECAVITRLAVQRTKPGVMGPSSMGTVRPPGASRSGHRSPIRCPDRYPRSHRLPTGGTWQRTCHG